MAGRGGYKPTTSLRPEQLQGMGITGKEMQSATVTLPPTFPPLINRYVITEKSTLCESTFNKYFSHLIYSAVVMETDYHLKNGNARGKLIQDLNIGFSLLKCSNPLILPKTIL